jgi:hypothetical protein
MIDYCHGSIENWVVSVMVLDSLIRTRLDTLAERSRIYAKRCRSSPIRPNFYGNDYIY